MPSIRACDPKRTNAARSGSGPEAASSTSAPLSDRPAAIDDTRSRKPSGHAACTSRNRVALRSAKNARGSDATATAGTTATSTVPVTRVPMASATDADRHRSRPELQRGDGDAGLREPELLRAPTAGAWRRQTWMRGGRPSRNPAAQ